MATSQFEMSLKSNKLARLMIDENVGSPKSEFRHKLFIKA